MVDVIIPLGNGSRSNNDELRLFLRSLEKYGCGYRNVIVAGDAIPNWLQNVTVCDGKDSLIHNKDGNIIRKVLTAAALPDITPDFVWSSDDCVFLQPLDLENLPPIFNRRCKEDFPADGSIWQRRVLRTFNFLESRGMALKHNFESHTPQRFPARKLLRAVRNVDYASDIGYSINTLFYGLLGVSGGFDQNLVKETREEPGEAKLNRMLCGYNDRAFLGGFREQLFRRFPDKSKYEKSRFDATQFP